MDWINISQFLTHIWNLFPSPTSGMWQPIAPFYQYHFSGHNCRCVVWETDACSPTQYTSQQRSMLCLSQVFFLMWKEMKHILGHHFQAQMHSLHCMPTQTLHSGLKSWGNLSTKLNKADKIRLNWKQYISYCLFVCNLFNLYLQIWSQKRCFPFMADNKESTEIWIQKTATGQNILLNI